MVDFNPTAGIPKTSYNSKSNPNDPNNMTWFSTVQPPEDYKQIDYLGHCDPIKEKT